MSIDKSLKLADSLVRSRNVLTRAERMEALRDQGKWDEGESSIFGLPKVRVYRAKRRGKAAEKKEEAAADAEAAAPAAEENAGGRA